MTQLTAKSNISASAPNPLSSVARDGFAAVWDFLSEMFSYPEVDIGCSATLNIGGQISARLRLTGAAVTITSLGTFFRGPILIRCSADYNFTHNSTSLLCPGNVNLTAKAGAILQAHPKCSVSGVHDGWVLVVLSSGNGGLTLAGPLTSSTGVAILDFPTGTRKIFQQTSAPPGWTKDTTAAMDNTALRIVTGAVGSRTNGIAFTTCFATTATGGHSLTKAELAPHSHLYDRVNKAGTPNAGTYYIGSIGDWASYATEAGTADGLAGAAHTHPLALAVNYYDCIVASKV